MVPITSTPANSKQIVSRAARRQPSASETVARIYTTAASADSVKATGASPKRSMIWNTERPVAAIARIAYTATRTRPTPADRRGRPDGDADGDGFADIVFKTKPVALSRSVPCGTP